MADGTRSAQHGLVLPVDADVLGLAQSWFPEAEWIRMPETKQVKQQLVGARFGRTPAAKAEFVPGVLRLNWGAQLVGPQGLGVLSTVPTLPEGVAQVFLLEHDGDEPEARVGAWLAAAARRVGGVHVVDGTVAPASDAGIGVSVYAGEPLAPEVALTLVRSAAPMAQLAESPPSPSLAPFRIVVPSEFDGTVDVQVRRASELPVSLLQLDATDYGPYAFTVSWSLLGAEPDSPAHRIARDRSLPVVARIAVALQRSTKGSIVDEGGFVVKAEEVQSRASALTGGGSRLRTTA